VTPSGTLVLASRSPQRRAILAQLGVDFRVVEPPDDEIEEGDPRALVVQNARRKARAVDADLVLGVDTTVVLDGRSFGKPADESQAEATLRRLSGRRHEVLSGLCLRERGAERSSCARTAVTFRRLEPPDIEWYVASGEWRGRAGGYAIQGRGAALVESIEGDYWNVVGLPVAELVRMRPGLLWGA
jgi:septum formation protein